MTDATAPAAAAAAVDEDAWYANDDDEDEEEDAPASPSAKKQKTEDQATSVPAGENASATALAGDPAAPAAAASPPAQPANPGAQLPTTPATAASFFSFPTQAGAAQTPGGASDEAIEVTQHVQQAPQSGNWDAKCVVVRQGQLQLELQRRNPPLKNDDLIRFSDWLTQQLPPILQAFPYVRKSGCMVDLSENIIGPQGLDKLLTVLRDHKVPCNTLKVYRNCLDDTIVDTLVEYFYTQPQGNAIQAIHMSHNRITANGCKRLLTAAAKCTHYPRMAGENQLFPLWLRLESNAIENPAHIVKVEMKDAKICLMQDGHCSKPDCDHWNVHVQLPHFLVQDPHNENRAYEHGEFEHLGETSGIMQQFSEFLDPDSQAAAAAGGMTPAAASHNGGVLPPGGSTPIGNGGGATPGANAILGNLTPQHKGEILLIAKGIQTGHIPKETGQKLIVQLLSKAKGKGQGGDGGGGTSGKGPGGKGPGSPPWASGSGSGGWNGQESSYNGSWRGDGSGSERHSLLSKYDNGRSRRDDDYSRRDEWGGSASSTSRAPWGSPRDGPKGYNSKSFDKDGGVRSGKWGGGRDSYYDRDGGGSKYGGSSSKSKYGGGSKGGGKYGKYDDGGGKSHDLRGGGKRSFDKDTRGGGGRSYDLEPSKGGKSSKGYGNIQSGASFDKDQGKSSWGISRSSSKDSFAKGSQDSFDYYGSKGGGGKLSGGSSFDHRSKSTGGGKWNGGGGSQPWSPAGDGRDSSWSAPQPPARPRHIDVTIAMKSQPLGFEYEIEKIDEVDTAVVKSVAADSEASKKGVVAGMKVIRMNGIDVSMFDANQIQETVKKRANGFSLRFK
ncbi:unnamed protein product [Amoebophrya sp. A25]|nr:unnamed protein product [Amoebophrya sp. A25]|eukprot:GSA25T00013474001.1